MLLSKLVFLAIKNVIYQSEDSFTYESFMKGDFDDDTDFKMQIVNAFTPLNEAISRLSDLERIPYRCEDIIIENGNSINLTNFGHKVKEIIGANDGSRAYSFRIFGDILCFEKCFRNKHLFIEYKEDIPVFSESDLVELVEDEYGHITDNNIDLSTYGLSESVCNYIIEYVKGRLLEPIAPELANLHITTAETYFTNINPNKVATVQGVVQRKYNIGD